MAVQTLDRAMAELLGDTVIATRRLAVSSRALRNAMADGEMTFEIAQEILRDVHSAARYLVAQVSSLDDALQPKLPGFDKGDA